ncbi:MAG: hypothetical protein JNK85_21445 [Verrucomicrobiales bacterium]|nr:hypothetical protein [Verrucomicrobiales bacterium]
MSVLSVGIGTGRAELPEPWRFLAPLPQGNSLLAAWAAAPDDLFVGGHGGVILHWDGRQWTSHRTPTHKTIFALHGISRTNLWAVGGDPYTEVQTNRCLILHFDGQQWTEQVPPTFAGTTYPLNAVWAIAPDDVWATQDSGTFVAHYDGKKWDLVSLPLSLDSYSSFRAVTAAGPDHLFVAGTHGQIAHRDHGTWRLEQKLDTGSFTVNIIGALRAFDAEHVYASGNWNQFYQRRSDGTWQSIPVPSSGPFGDSLFVIGGTSPTDVYLMGVQSILHYAGTTPVSRLDLSLAMRRQWFAGCATGDRLYGVGPNGVVHEYRVDGKGGGVLSPLTAGGRGDLRLRLNGAAGCGPHGVIAYGFTFDLPSEPPLLYFEHGTFHRFPVLPDGMQGSTEVKAVLAPHLDDVTVAWENFGDFQRGVAHWDGQRWSAIAGRTDQARGVIGLWRSPQGRLYAAEPFRLLHRSEDDDWVQDFAFGQEQIDDPIVRMAARSSTEIYLATRQGRLHRFDGSTVRKETTPDGPAVITALLATETEIYAVGQNGLAWRRTTSSWERVRGITPRDQEPFTALAQGAAGVFACQSTPGNITGGGLGRVWKLTDGSAQLEVEGLSQNLEALASTASGYLIGLTSQDFVVARGDSAEPATLARLESSSNWQAIGTTGVRLRTEPALASRPVVGIHRASAPLPFARSGASTDNASGVHGETWRLFKDRYTTGTALPPVSVGVLYRWDALPEAWRTEGVSLGLFAEGASAETASEWDPASYSLTSLASFDATVWTLRGITASAPPPELGFVRTADGRITLTWKPEPATLRLQSSRWLGSEAVWTDLEGSVSHPDGTKTMTLETTQASRYFRLRAEP